MKNLTSILLAALIMLSCTDSMQYILKSDTTTKILFVGSKSVALKGTMSGKISCVRGFLISRYNIPTFRDKEIQIEWCNDGIDDFSKLINLEHGITYFAVSFCYYPRHADDVSYGNAVYFKTK